MWMPWHENMFFPFEKSALMVMHGALPSLSANTPSNQPASMVMHGARFCVPEVFALEVVLLGWTMLCGVISAVTEFMVDVTGVEAKRSCGSFNMRRGVRHLYALPYAVGCTASNHCPHKCHRNTLKGYER
jgi:hypothetical protein